MKSLYLLVHVLTVLFPLLWSFEPKINYAKKWKALLPGLFITAGILLLWDIVFTRLGIWGFNEMYILGAHILGLPVEEWLFFITIPFASVFIYECVLFFFPKIRSTALLRLFTVTLAMCLMVVSLLNTARAYTCWNFLFAGIFLMYTAYKNPSWMGTFWLTYLFHLIPFLLVNGILTGSFIAQEVVWYNNQENLNIRIGTIPIEDFIYSLLLLLLNVSFFEWFKKYYRLK